MAWRSRNYKFHTSVGLALVVFLGIIGLTGAILVFDPEIDALTNPPAVAASTLTTLQPDVAEEILRKEFPDNFLKGIFLPTDSDARFRAELESDDGNSTVFLNAKSGQIIGRAEHPWREAILNLHHSLWLGDWGMAVMFFVALGCVLLSSSGLIVHRKSWKALTHLPRFKRSRRLGFSDLHKAIGVLVFVFLFVLGATGAWMNAEAFGNFQEGKPEKPVIAEAAEKYVAAEISMKKAFEIARQSIDNFQPGYLRFPREDKKVIRVSGLVAGQEFYGPHTSRVEIDSETGAVLKIRDLSSEKWPGKTEYLVETLHYASFGGFWLKFLYCLASIGLVAICVTGSMIWWKRSRK